jgi:hypothetical protein
MKALSVDRYLGGFLALGLLLALASSSCTLVGDRNVNSKEAIQQRAYEAEWNEAVAERPPCRLPPLSEEEVLSIAKEALGDLYLAEKGFSEPNREVVERGCVYYYLQSLLYVNGTPIANHFDDG